MSNNQEVLKAINEVKGILKKHNISIFSIIKDIPITTVRTVKEVYTTEGKVKIRLDDVDINIPSNLIGYINNKGEQYCYSVLKENSRTLEANDIRRIYNKDKQDNINNAIDIVSKAIQAGKNFSQFNQAEKQALKVVNENRKKK